MKQRKRLERLQIFAWLEAHCFSGWDIHFRAGTRIPSDARLARFDREDAKPSQLNPIVGLEGIFHGIKDGVNRLLGFCLANTRPLDDLIDKIEFDHLNLRLISVCLLSLLRTYSYHPKGALGNAN